MPPLTQPPPSTPEGPADAGLEHVGSTLRQMVGRFFKDSALYGLSSFASMSIGIVLIPILSRVFLPKDFGIIEMIASFIAIAVPLSRCGNPGRTPHQHGDSGDFYARLVRAGCGCLPCGTRIGS
jgi:hypothetical protein